MNLFKLLGTISVDTGDAEKKIDGVTEKAEATGASFGEMAKKIGSFTTKAVLGIAGVVTATAGAVIALQNKTTSYMDTIDKGASRLGLTVEAYQEWSHAMGQSGIQINEMMPGMNKLMTMMTAANTAGSDAAKMFQELGVAMYDSNGNMRSREDVMKDVILSLAAMEDKGRRAELAFALFGETGAKLNPLLDSGAQGIEALIQQAHDLGFVFDDVTVKAGVTLGDTMANIRKSFEVISLKLGIALMPTMQKLCDYIMNNMPAIIETVQAFADALMEGLAWLVENKDVIIDTVKGVFKLLFPGATEPRQSAAFLNTGNPALYLDENGNSTLELPQVPGFGANRIEKNDYPVEHPTVFQRLWYDMFSPPGTTGGVGKKFDLPAQDASTIPTVKVEDPSNGADSQSLRNISSGIDSLKTIMSHVAANTAQQPTVVLGRGVLDGIAGWVNTSLGKGGKS